MAKIKAAASGNGAILQEIFALLAPFNKNNIELNENHDLNADLDVDSVAALDLLMNIEDKFDISISINHLSEIHTVGDLAKVVTTVMQKK